MKYTKVRMPTYCIVISAMICTQCTFPAQTHTISVKTITATSTTKPKILTSIGRVQGVHTAYIQALVPGQIKSILVTEGTYVHKGQLLATLNSDKEQLAVTAAHAQVRKAKALLANQQITVNRIKILTKQKSATLSQLEDAQVQLILLKSAYQAAYSQLNITQLNLSHTQIKATVGGTIQEKKITVGSVITVGTPVFMITNKELLEALLPFPQTSYSLTKVGQSVTLYNLAASSAKTNPITTAITAIKPMINPMTYSFQVICQFKNIGNWKAGSSVKAHINVNPGRKIILIPLISVMHDQQGPYVFITDGNKAIIKRITIASQTKNLAIVMTGIQPGDFVITDGASFLHNNELIMIVK